MKSRGDQVRGCVARCLARRAVRSGPAHVVVKEPCDLFLLGSFRPEKKKKKNSRLIFLFFFLFPTLFPVIFGEFKRPSKRARAAVRAHQLNVFAARETTAGSKECLGAGSR